MFEWANLQSMYYKVVTANCHEWIRLNIVYALCPSLQNEGGVLYESTGNINATEQRMSYVQQTWNADCHEQEVQCGLHQCMMQRCT